MKHEQWIRLTPDKQKRMVHELSGHDAKLCPVHMMYECCGRRIPEYIYDLNAMFEAEKSLEGAKRGRYYEHLLDVVTGPWSLIRLTAAQRAEAFVQTMEEK
jgi:hypothetical protein